MSKQITPQVSPEEIVAQALNEQGFLLHHRVLGAIHAVTKATKQNDGWAVEAFEMPVSLPNQDETRIDIVLRHRKPGSPWWVVMESKRASPEYKRWVFFAQNRIDRSPSPNSYFIEHAKLAGTWTENNQPEPPMWHGINPKGSWLGCPVFDFGIEARLNGTDKHKRVSATEAIEDAMRQVILGQAGLALKLRASHELLINLIPVVVTTAELMSAKFDATKVSLSHGRIESKDLKLKSRKWLAMNYRISDVICTYSLFTPQKKLSMADFLRTRHVRTVFVVHAKHILEFLIWLENYFPNT